MSLFLQNDFSESTATELTNLLTKQ